MKAPLPIGKPEQVLDLEIRRFEIGYEVDMWSYWIFRKALFNCAVRLLMYN